MRISIFILIALIVAPAVLPAQQPAAPAKPPTVLVLSFEPIAETANTRFIAQGIQQTLFNDLARRQGLATGVLPKSAIAALDTEDATKAGKSAGADFALFGTYQLVDEEVRITGQFVKVATGNLVGSIRATGSIRDLFALQDSLAEQLRKLISSELAPPPPPAPPVQPAPAPQANPNNPFAVQPVGPVRDPQWNRDDALLERARFRADDYWYNRYNYGYPTYPYWGTGIGYGYGFCYPRMYYPYPVFRLPSSPTPRNTPYWNFRAPFGNRIGYVQMTLNPPRK